MNNILEQINEIATSEATPRQVEVTVWIDKDAIPDVFDDLVAELEADGELGREIINDQISNAFVDAGIEHYADSVEEIGSYEYELDENGVQLHQLFEINEWF